MKHKFEKKNAPLTCFAHDSDVARHALTRETAHVVAARAVVLTRIRVALVHLWNPQNKEFG